MSDVALKEHLSHQRPWPLCVYGVVSRCVEESLGLETQSDSWPFRDSTSLYR